MLRGRVCKSDVIRGYQDVPAWAHGSPDPAASKLLPDVPSEELQRQQLERLLFKRNADCTPSTEAQSTTYRIDLPSPEISTHEGSPYVPGDSGRIRSSSEPAERSSWQLQNLRNLFTGQRQSHQANTWKDPRERRREEIERAADPRSSIVRTPASAYDGFPGNPLASSPAHRYT